MNTGAGALVHVSYLHSDGAVSDAVYLKGQTLQLDLLFRDLTFAWRNAIRRPAFTLLVVLTLALGIGAEAALARGPT